MKKKNKSNTVNVCMELKNFGAKEMIIISVTACLCFFIARLFNLNNEQDIKVIMRLILCGTAVYGIYLRSKGKLDSSALIFLVLIVGVVLRFGYTEYTNAFVRAHDMGGTDANGVGHYGYIKNILDGHLPKSNEYQFYHPPLFHALSALFIKAAMLFSGKTSPTDFLYMSQLVSCTASCVMLFVMKKTLDELNISKNVQLIALAITAVYPAQIYSAGRANNDMLAFMFMMCAFYFAVKWHKNMKMRDIIGIALSIGFGMMTKINCGIAAIIIGPVMLYHLAVTIKSSDKDKIKSLIIQLAVFAVICFPLGLWYPIRNYIEFGQPLNFVHDLGKNHVVYTGDASFAQRWLLIPFTQFIKTPFMQMNTDTSIPMALIKTGVHGEFQWDDMSNFLAWSIEYVHAAFMLLTAVFIPVIMLKDNERTLVQKVSVFSAWAVMAVSFVSFNISYPYMCTADFRYVFLCQAAGVVFVGFGIDYLKRQKRNKMLSVSIGITMLFCAMSIIHIC